MKICLHVMCFIFSGTIDMEGEYSPEHPRY